MKAVRPPYAPGVLLKLYLYGYLNKLLSSRKLEKERLRNIELQWLLQNLQPSYHLRMLEQYGHDITLCPKCRQGKLVLIAIVYPGRSAVKLSATVTTVNEQVSLRNKASP